MTQAEALNELIEFNVRMKKEIKDLNKTSIDKFVIVTDNGTFAGDDCRTGIISYALIFDTKEQAEEFASQKNWVDVDNNKVTPVVSTYGVEAKKVINSINADIRKFKKHLNDYNSSK